MRIAVFGSGGREHALCWRLMQDSAPPEITCFPGNPGIRKIVHACEPMQKNFFELAASMHGKFALAVIGPEQLLAAGLADRLREVGIPVFGPSAIAAKIESSKFFSKSFMDRWGIPTARWDVVSHIDAARLIVHKLGGPPIVLKADGLAGGKGVLVCKTAETTEEALYTLFVERTFGDASQIVVVEEKLAGDEVSFIGISDGKKILDMPCSMDYKQALAGDKGLNTGGMGAHSPSFILTDEMRELVQNNVMQRAVDGLRAEGREFRGALYAGLMVSYDRKKIHVLEFNARFGDPETQVLMLRLDEDLTPLLFAAAAGNLPDRKIKCTDDVAVCVVLTSAPYPKNPVVGEDIFGLAEAEKMPGVHLFHAGTAVRTDGTLVTAGGRVLNICAKDKTLPEALVKVYAAAYRVTWPHKDFRGDIGCRVSRMP